jgi:hypothetical protein
VLADATDSDFWERVQLNEGIHLVILAMPKHSANLHAAETLKRHGYQGVVAAIAKFDDEMKLVALGGCPYHIRPLQRSWRRLRRSCLQCVPAKAPRARQRYPE